MKEKLYGDLEFELKVSRDDFCRPLVGVFELTYACSLNCVHCYCKGSEDSNGELSLKKIKDIFSQLQALGCIRLALSGGEPFLRKDFIDIYLAAKDKGFLIDIFTSGHDLSEEILATLKKFPPFGIEVTLNGVSKNTYEAVTRKPGSFGLVLNNIKRLKQEGLPLLIKSNCLSLNRLEIHKIKSFTKELFGRNSKRFRFDPVILPRLNSDKSPCAYRISADQMSEIFRSDPEIMLEYREALSCAPGLARDNKFLYQCSSWRNQFFINPFGRIKFCQFSNEFSLDLKHAQLKEYIEKLPEKILSEEFKTHSKCINCNLRPVCYYCPGRAYLETGSREGPVPYFCQLARTREKESREFINA